MLKRWRKKMIFLLIMLIAAGCAMAWVVAKKNKAGIDHAFAQYEGKMSAGNFDGAVMSAKRAVEASPDSGKARLILGHALLSAGKFASAEIELRRALDLKIADSEVLPLLARAMLGQDKGLQLISQFREYQIADAGARAAFDVHLGEAFMRVGDHTEAIHRIDKSLAASPNNFSALLLRAKIVTASKGPVAGLQLVDDIIRANPENAEALLLKARILIGTGEGVGDILPIVDKVTSLSPHLLEGQELKALIHLRNKNLVGARVAMLEIQKHQPNSPAALFLHASILESEGDHRQAKDLAEALLKAEPSSLRALTLLARIEMKLGDLRSAESHLKRAMGRYPEAVAPRLLLANIYIPSGDPKRGLEVLDGVGKNKRDSELTLKMQAQALMMLKDFKSADGVFRQALEKFPDDRGLKLGSALARVGAGDTNPGLDGLDKLAASTSDYSTEMVLISTLIEKKQWEKADIAIDRLAKNESAQVISAHLRGATALYRDRVSVARRQFDAALKLDPNFRPSLLALASLDLDDGQLDAARQRLDEYVKRNPRDGLALIALGEALLEAGEPHEKLSELFNRAVQVAKMDAGVRLAQINYLLLAGKTREAASAVDNALLDLPNSPELLDAQARVFLANKEYNQAISTYSKIATQSPSDATALLKLADAQSRIGNTAGMIGSIKRANEIDPNHQKVAYAMGSLMLWEGRQDDARKIAQKMQAAAPEDAMGFVLEAEMEMRASNWDSASRLLKRALAKKNSQDIVYKLHVALAAGGKSSEAESLIEGFRSRHPQNIRAALYHADFLLGSGMPSKAEVIYRSVLKRRPADVRALNNLAHALVRQGKQGAGELLERGIALQPTSPQLRDSLALVLSNGRRHEQAILMQKEAIKLSPEEPDYKFQLAQLLSVAGDRHGAKVELQKLSELGARYHRQSEVGALLRSL